MEKKSDLNNIELWMPEYTPEQMIAMMKDNSEHINDADITLEILGEPKAQKRHRSVKMESFIRQYDPSSADKADFLSMLQKEAPDTPFNTPLDLTLTFYFSRPKSHYKTGKNSHSLKDNAPNWHTSRPDCDNLAKFCLDALNKVYWRDDSLICSINVKKKYSDNPRTKIEITKI